MKKVLLFLFLILLSCSNDEVAGGDGSSQLPQTENPETQQEVISDSELLDLTQETTFKYFWDFAHPNAGAALERYHPEDPSHDSNTVAIGGTGFGLMAILVGIERGFISREAGVLRLQKIANFLSSADRFHGAWPHWLDGKTGKVKSFSAKDNGGDLVETAFLAQGLISVQEYFKEGIESEKALSQKAEALWHGIEWDWYTNKEKKLLWHWSPDYGFEINLGLKGYNETLIAYVLAAAAPNHTIEKDVYDNGWATQGAIKSTNERYNFPLIVNHPGSPNLGGPLFFSHYSFLGLNPNGLADAYVNYGQAAVSHTNINYQYCVENPKNFIGYGKDCWGLTASYTRRADGGIGYMAHSPVQDVGVITPSAALSSFPYTPEHAMRALRYFYKNKSKLLGPAGFYDAFSPQYNFWVAKAYLAIDQGPQIIMIENYRTGLLWKLFMQNKEVQQGLDKLGFVYTK
jgi:hypothetical protein